MVSAKETGLHIRRNTDQGLEMSMVCTAGTGTENIISRKHIGRDVSTAAFEFQ